MIEPGTSFYKQKQLVKLYHGNVYDIIVVENWGNWKTMDATLLWPFADRCCCCCPEAFKVACRCGISFDEDTEKVILFHH